MSGGELGLGDFGGVLERKLVVDMQDWEGCDGAYLVGLVGGGRCRLALLTGRELGEVTVVVSLPGEDIIVSTAETKGGMSSAPD